MKKEAYYCNNCERIIADPTEGYKHEENHLCDDGCVLEYLLNEGIIEVLEEVKG